MREGTILRKLSSEPVSIWKRWWYAIRGRLQDGHLIEWEAPVIAIREEPDMDGYFRVDEVQLDISEDFRPWLERTDFEELEDVTPMLYVNLYMYDRAYGGPEEGGWYYDVYDPIEDVALELGCDPVVAGFGKFEKEEQAKDGFERARLWAEAANEGRPSASSSISQGEYRVLLEGFPPAPYPAQRPHYC